MMRINEAYTCAYWCALRVCFEFHNLSVNGHHANVCLHAAAKFNLLDNRMHEGCRRPLPYISIDCILACTILKAQQAIFSPQFGLFSFALQLLWGFEEHTHTQHQKKRWQQLATTKATMMTLEEKIGWHTPYGGIRYCIRFRQSSEWLGIVWNGTWGCGKWRKKREAHTHLGMWTQQ